MNNNHKENNKKKKKKIFLYQQWWVGETGIVKIFRVGETEVGEMGVGEMGQIIGETGVDKMGVILKITLTKNEKQIKQIKKDNFKTICMQI